MKRSTLKELKNLQEKNRKFKRKIKQSQNGINLLEYKEIKDRTETINSLIKETLNEELNNIEEVEPESEDSTEIEESSNKIFTSANGKNIIALGKVKLNFEIQEKKLPIKLQVIESKEEKV